MSLINQMLRDLEMRNNNRPANSVLEIHTAEKQRYTSNFLKLLPIFTLVLAYFAWQHYQALFLSGTTGNLTQLPTVSSADPQPITNTQLQSQPLSQAPIVTAAKAQIEVQPISQAELVSPDPVKTQAQPLLIEEKVTQAATANLSPESSAADKASAKVKIANTLQTNNKPSLVIHPVTHPENQTQASVKLASTKPKSETMGKPNLSPDKINLVTNTLQTSNLIKPEKPVSISERIASLFLAAKKNPSLSNKSAQLETILQLNPQFLPARTLLLETLIKNKATNQELSRFTDDSLQIFPHNLQFKKTKAHLYILQKNFIAAVNLLENDNLESTSDSEYLALLAGCYAQLQRYPQAASIYLKLTQIEADKAENWLGLGVSEDKLNQAKLAINAYQQALDKNTLQGEVVDYIKQRLQVLN
ncbi:hypothetical protein [Methylomonas sp. AM2-LC]|uniref:tetratricopeptide repeat protein n=1 Tax=Methylomonas sp. AM2-LC TaxID=3153301 RepID=UPI0032635160